MLHVRPCRLSVLLTIVLFAAPYGFLRAQSTAPDADRIRAVVAAYLHGLKFNDVDSLRAAFWPSARLFYVKRDGTIGQMTQAEWYRSFAPAARKEESGDLRIASLDITDNAASVKVVETYDKSIYVDYLSLLRFDGDWRIVNKIYTSRPRVSLSLVGTYATHVTLLPDSNSCGAVTVQDNPTTVTLAPGATAISITHAGNTYAGTVDESGGFTTKPTLLTAGGGRYTLTIAGQFSPTGFDATVHVAVQQPTPPQACAYEVHWAGSKNSLRIAPSQ